MLLEGTVRDATICEVQLDERLTSTVRVQCAWIRAPLCRFISYKVGVEDVEVALRYRKMSRIVVCEVRSHFREPEEAMRIPSSMVCTSGMQ